MLSIGILQKTWQDTYRRFTPNNSGQRLQPSYYRGCWHEVSRCLFLRYRRVSSLRKDLYTPKSFIGHAASLLQAFAHWGRFLTAASRRSLGSVSVPVWLVVFSNQLPVIALVSHYLTNKLMGSRLLSKWWIFTQVPEGTWTHLELAPLSRSYAKLRVGYQLVTHPFATVTEETVRLACLKHAASVRPEPGSNSQIKLCRLINLNNRMSVFVSDQDPPP